MFSQEQLLDYLRRAKKGDETAKEVLFNENSPLIRSIIRRFKDKGVEYEDLYQIACIGFVKAVNNFDENFEVKFSTYCVPMIIGEIKRYMRDNGAIKVSRALKILANKINRFVDEFVSTHSDAPSVEVIAKEFNIDIEEVKKSIMKIKDIRDVHHIHLWSISEHNIALECHVESCNADVVVTITEVLKNKFGINHCNIQVETTSCGQFCDL